jgi:hypothetical protein
MEKAGDKVTGFFFVRRPASTELKPGAASG